MTRTEWDTILNVVKYSYVVKSESKVSVKTRRVREKEELRAEILEAARELFVKEGYENVSMRRIAEKIDYSPTTIYLYFRDKADLLTSICEETFTQLVKQFEEIEATTSDPVERLTKAGRAYVEFGLAHPNHYRLTFMKEPAAKEALSAQNYQYRGSAGERCFSHMGQMVADCVQAGRFRNADIEATSQALWCATHGVVSAMIAHPLFPWVEKEKLITQLLEIIANGLKV